MFCRCIFFFFNSVIPGVVILAVLLPYAVYCTCHMVRPVALVQLREAPGDKEL